MRRDRTVSDDAAVISDEGRRVARLIELGLDRAAATLGARTSETARRATDAGATLKPLDQIDQLGPVVAGVVDGIRRDQLDNATPCTAFTVRDLLRHMVRGAQMFAAAFRGATPPDVDMPEDVLAAFGPALGDLAGAMHEPGALDRTVNGPLGAVKGEALARFVALDGLVHGWDFATATSQPYDPPNELVAAVTAFAETTLGPLRDGDTFAPATQAPHGASAMERLAALTGRRVS